MNITKGSVIKRGKRGSHTWSWKYQRDGQPRWETLNLPLGASKREAELLRDVKLARCRNESSELSISSTQTVDELSVQYLEHAKNYYVKPDGRPTGEAELIGNALSVLRRRYGKLKALELGPLKLKKVREDMVSLGWKRSTINGHVGRIRRVYRWGVGNELMPVSVLQSLQAVSGLKRGRTKAAESEKVRPVPLSHINKVEPFVSRQVWAMIQLQLLTGARGGELCILKPINFDTSEDIWKATPSEHKTEHHEQGKRVIYFGPKAQKIVKKFMTDRSLDAYLFSPRDAAKERNSVAKTHRRPNQKTSPRKSERTIGKHYTIDSYRRAITRACKEAGISDWTPHRLRHNAGTKVRKEYGLDSAQVILGHTSANVTEVYAEADEAKAMEIIREIG